MPHGSGRATWLVLARDGPAAVLPDHAPDGVVRLVDSRSEFDALLRAALPRLAIVTSLPADATDLERLARELRRDGEAVHLRPKESRPLALLATHSGRAYSRRELLERIWGPRCTGDARTIDGHIRWLRSKVEAEPERQVHLVTVRATGSGSIRRPAERRR